MSKIENLTGVKIYIGDELLHPPQSGDETLEFSGIGPISATTTTLALDERIRLMIFWLLVDAQATADRLLK